MNILFEEAFLKKYGRHQLGQHMNAVDLEWRVREVLQSTEMDNLIDRELQLLDVSPEGNLLALAGVCRASLKPLVKPFIMDLVSEVVSDILGDLTHLTVSIVLNSSPILLMEGRCLKGSQPGG